MLHFENSVITRMSIILAGLAALRRSRDAACRLYGTSMNCCRHRSAERGENRLRNAVLCTSTQRCLALEALLMRSNVAECGMQLSAARNSCKGPKGTAMQPATCNVHQHNHQQDHLNHSYTHANAQDVQHCLKDAIGAVQRLAKDKERLQNRLCTQLLVYMCTSTI